MKRKLIEYIILFSAIFILSLTLIFQGNGKIHYKLPSVPDFDIGALSSFEISKNGETIRFEKEDDTWIIKPQNYPGNKSKINKILESLENIRLDGLVSESGNPGMFGLDKDSRMTVTGFSENEILFEYYFGETAATTTHTYFDFKNAVYLAEGNYTASMNLPIDEFRNHSVSDINIDQVRKIIITYDDRTKTTLEKKTEITGETNTNSYWLSGADGKTGTKKAMQNLLDTYEYLLCEFYYEDLDKTDFIGLEPLQSVSFKTAGGDESRLSIYQKENGIIAVSSDSPYVFSLESWKLGTLFPAPAVLLTNR